VASLEVAMLWFGSAAEEVVLIGWWKCTSGMSPYAGCSATLMMVGRIWADDWLGGGGMIDSYGGVPSGCKHWLTLLGGMLGLSSSLEHSGPQMLG
jgi:hypothetical protein